MISKVELRSVIIGINPANGIGRPMFVRMHDVRPDIDTSRGTLHLRQDLDTRNALIGTLQRNVLSHSGCESADISRLNGFLRNEHTHARLGQLMRVRRGEQSVEQYVSAAVGRIALPITDNFVGKPFEAKQLYELAIDGATIETAPLPPNSKLGSTFSSLGRTILSLSTSPKIIDRQARSCLEELQKAISSGNITPSRAVVLCSILECAQRKLQVLDKGLGLSLNRVIQPLKTAIVDASRVIAAPKHEEAQVAVPEIESVSPPVPESETAAPVKHADQTPPGRIMTEEDLYDPDVFDLDLWADIFSDQDLEALMKAFPEFAPCKESPIPERFLQAPPPPAEQEPEQEATVAATTIGSVAAPVRIMTEEDLFNMGEPNDLYLWTTYISAKTDKKDLQQLTKDFPEFKPCKPRKVPERFLQAAHPVLQEPVIKEAPKAGPFRAHLKRGPQQRLFSAAAVLPDTLMPKKPQAEETAHALQQKVPKFKPPMLPFRTVDPPPRLAAIIAREPVLGGRIRILRENEGLTPTEFVKLINDGTDGNTGMKFNLSTSTYSYVEKRDAPPHARYLYRMCEIFRKGAEWILYAKGFPAAIAGLAENEKIYFLMMRKGLTMEQLAARMDNTVTRSAICYWIKGPTFPEGETRQALCKALDYPDIYRNASHVYSGRTSYDELLLSALAVLAKSRKPFTIEDLASEAGVSNGRARLFYKKHTALFIEQNTYQEAGRQ